MLAFEQQLQYSRFSQEIAALKEEFNKTISQPWLNVQYADITQRQSVIAKFGLGARTEKGRYGSSLSAFALDLFRKAGAGPHSTCVECGSGTGEIGISVVALFKSKVTAIEYDHDLFTFSTMLCKWLNTKGVLPETENPQFIKRDFFDVSISSADILYYYQNSSLEPEQFENKLLHEMRPGAKIILFGYRDLPQAYKFPKLFAHCERQDSGRGSILTLRENSA